MRLTRCSDQKSASLDEFYTRASQHDSAGGEAMLDLIARLRALPDERQVFGLTSHQRLCLLTEDTYQSPWMVIVSALNNRNYLIEYRMPDNIAPWPNAYVRGEARSEDEAVSMIVIAIENSGGWKH